jgi:hypothetical protein
MHDNHTPVRRPRLWLIIGAVVSTIAIAALWPLREVGQVCVLIYPAPPGCGATEPRWVPLVAIGLVIGAFGAMIVVYFTASRPRTALIVLVGVIVLVAILAAAVVALSQTGIWDPYQPPVIVN